MGWFANRRARAARETGVEASGAFCRAVGQDEHGPDVAAPAPGGSSAPQCNDVRGLTRLACGAITLLALSGVLAMEGCAAVSTDAENSAASEQAAAASASDVEYASFEEVAAAFDESALDLDYSKRDLDASYDASSPTVITLSGDSTSVQGAGAQASAAGVVISSAGTYIVSGELTDGQLLVDAGDDDKVQLVLAGATIHNEDGPAIYVRNVDKCFVTLDAGTENGLSDGSSYTLEDDSDEPYATLFSRCDLTLNGDGTLNVISAYRHAVCSKDDLVVVSGTYNISAVEDGLRGRDSVKVRDGVFAIQAGGDGIKSNKDDDPTKGFVSIDGGTFGIQAGDDVVQGKTLVRLAGGSLTVAANDDAFHSDLEMHLLGASMEAGAGDDAFHAETKLTVDGGTVNVTSCNEGYEAEKVYVNGGDMHIVASDDGVNASAADLSDDADADNVSSTLPNGGTPGAPGKGGGVRRRMPAARLLQVRSRAGKLPTPLPSRMGEPRAPQVSNRVARPPMPPVRSRAEALPSPRRAITPAAQAAPPIPDNRAATLRPAAAWARRIAAASSRSTAVTWWSIPSAMPSTATATSR